MGDRQPRYFLGAPLLLLSFFLYDFALAKTLPNPHTLHARPICPMQTYDSAFRLRRAAPRPALAVYLACESYFLALLIPTHNCAFLSDREESCITMAG